MRRFLRVGAWSVAALVLLVATLGGALFVAGNTDAGRGFIERVTDRLTSGTVKLAGLAGSFPSRLTLQELQLVDGKGVWLTADGIALTWSPWRLLEHRITVHTLEVARLHVERAPLSSGPGGGPVTFPTVEIGAASLPVVELGAPLVGTAASVSLHGGLRLRSLDDADAAIEVRRLGGDGEYSLHLRFDPNRIDAALTLHEPAGGPLEHLLGVPGLGALSATVDVRGPRRAEVVGLVLAAGDLHANINGTVDLTHRSADLDYALHSPAVAPRSDVAWSAVSLDGNWHGALMAPNATGRLQIDQLRVGAATRISRLTATLTASGGKLGLTALVDEMQIPGPEPRFFAGDPLHVAASWQLDLPARPLTLDVTHSSFALHGRTETANGLSGPTAAALEMHVPELAAFQVFTGVDARGSAVLDAELTHRTDSDALKLNASVELAGRTAPWAGLLAPRATLQLGGSRSGTAFKVDNLRIAAPAFTLVASGGAEGVAPHPGADEAAGGGWLARNLRQLQARWQLDVSDLGALSTDLAGNMHVSGSVGGPVAALAGEAELTSQLSVRGSPQGSIKASLRARGLPAAPSATIEASGTLDGSPLALDATFDRSGTKAFHVAVRRADWKSAHAEGELTADPAFEESRGLLSLRIAQLSDLDRLLGTSLAGSVEGGIRVTPARGETQAELHLDGANLVIDGFAGNVHLEGKGVPSAVAMQLTANIPDFRGLPANLAATADLDLVKRNVRFATASLGYHGETVKLLAPAQISFANGLAVDDVRIGVQDALLEIQGEVAPVLGLSMSLRQVKSGLVNVFSPGLLTGGLIEARATLEGTTSRPTGRIRLDASDILFADDAATGLPALALHASAQLDGDAASVAASLEAGPASQLTASGTVPLGAGGALDLKIGGKLDVAVANPFLEARGMHATGQLTADATVTGPTADPQVGGSITLAQGSLRDYARGFNLTDMAADLGGGAGILQIKSFHARAVSGTVAMTGTIGVLQPGVPVDLTITAKNAQPVASSILTANLDADIHVSGTARRRLDVAGTVHVNRANIGIPDSLPPEVAVLDVRRRGKAVQAPAENPLVIGIDVDIQAPQQILVQGRGLDAEMGGDIRLRGTSDELVASGGLDLQRGSFTISGNKLNFSQDSKISFDGEGLRKKIDPTLNFTAQTTVGDTTVKLSITGFADAPRFDFSSVPAGLPQDSIMALLLFGQPAAQLSALQIAQVGYALATLSGVGGSTGNPLVKLQKSLGLDRLTVGTNTVNSATGSPENSGYAVAAGRYVTKRVYIEGKQTTTGTSQVQVDVDLTKRLKLQTRLGNGTATVQGTTPENDPGSSIGLSYQFEY